MMKKLLTASVCAAALVTAPALIGTSLMSTAHAAEPSQTSARDALDEYLLAGNTLVQAITALVEDGYSAADVVEAANGLANNDPDKLQEIAEALATVADALAASDDQDDRDYAAALDASVESTQLADAYADVRGTTGSINGGTGEVSPSNVGNSTSTNEAPASSS